MNVINSVNDDTVVFGMPPINVTVGVTNTTSEQEDADVTAQVVAWGWFAVVMICFLIKPRIPDPSMRRALIEREQRQRREAARKDPEKRKRVIDQSVITKVRRCCGNGIG